jgi:ABC-type lipoprotein release transport system permease subunit
MYSFGTGAGSPLRAGAADPATFLLVSMLLLFVALIASHLPARRAARIDPMHSCRSD